MEIARKNSIQSRVPNGMGFDGMGWIPDLRIFWMIPSYPIGNPDLKWKLQRHLKLHDNDLKKCLFCPWRCVTEAEEENANHYRLHTGLAGPKCEICGTKFASSRASKAHFLSLHERKNDRFKCKYCDFTTYYPAGVWSHEKKCLKKIK